MFFLVSKCDSWSGEGFLHVEDAKDIGWRVRGYILFNTGANISLNGAVKLFHFTRYFKSHIKTLTEITDVFDVCEIIHRYRLFLL